MDNNRKFEDISSSSKNHKKFQDISSSSKKYKKKVKKSQKPLTKGQLRAKKIFILISKFIISSFLILVITGSIVVTALTVYVMKFINTDTGIDLMNLELSLTSTLYAYDKNGNEVEVEKLYGSTVRNWVTIDQVPEHVKIAFIATEDYRFASHDGVDWKRTFGAFANLFLHFWNTEQGGSTITQQTVKNITGESQKRIDRKIQEIFRAMNLEKRFSKDQILEAYLNVIPMYYNMEGIGAASKYYFDKEVKDLTIPEAAALVAMAKANYTYNPIINPDNNKKRRTLVIDNMYKYGLEFPEKAVMTEEEWQKYREADITIDKGNIENKNSDRIYSYFADHIITTVVNDLVEEKGWKKEEARDQILNGGYKIYTTMDPTIQSIAEDFYEKDETFSSKPIKPAKGYNTLEENPFQSAIVIVDYQGQLKAVVGGKGEKKASRVLNIATQSTRSPGSTIKPLGVYSQAIDKNIITWSSLVQDSPITITEDGKQRQWPKNYSNNGTGAYLTVERALEESLNTIPVRILQKLTPEESFKFLTEKLKFTTLVSSANINGEVKSDITLAALALGSMTYNLKLLETTTAYQIFGNGGNFTPTTCYTKVVGPAGVVLEKTPKTTQVISEETATVMNRLMKQVIEGSKGTGKAAKMEGWDVVGKTGTSQDNKDFSFIGLNPYFITGIWMGYETPADLSNCNAYKPQVIYKNIMTEVMKSYEPKEFELSQSVKHLEYCTSSGMIAGANCPSKAWGYYKSDNVPGTCNKH